MKRESMLPASMKLSLQTTMPKAANREGREAFETLLEKMEHLGLYGLELNIPNLEEDIAPEQLQKLLAAHHLKLTYVASGVYAKARELGLSASDPEVREQAIEAVLRHMQYAEKMDPECGVIIGTLKGSPEMTGTDAEQQMIASLQKVFVRSRERGIGLHVPVVLEATNHYESSVANTLADTLRIVEAVNEDRLYLMPDTYHMNIEERDSGRAVRESLSHIRNIHLSDNNRYFPGYGALEFGWIYHQLQYQGYTGTYGIEGRIYRSLLEDLEESVEFLENVL